MFATGPYAHETQLVSPPVFSTFTTEPSTAPLTPPPELAHLTTPSSPDVPFAHFLSSLADLKNSDKTRFITANDLQATYSLYPGSPASSLISPITRNSGDCLSSSFPEREFPPQWDPSLSPRNVKSQRTGSGRLSGHDTDGVTMASQDTNFFCPATYAQFYLDQNPPFPHTGGRLSVSKDSDVQSTVGNGHQSRHTKSPKQDVEEIEAYRASFGFSADEIITTTQYVEISDVMDHSFTMSPFTSSKSTMEEATETPLVNEGGKVQERQVELRTLKNFRLESGSVNKEDHVPVSQGYEDHKLESHCSNSSALSTPDIEMYEEDIFSKLGSSRISRKYQMGLSCSDAEIDYGRGRSLQEG
ncbi:putative hydroxyproline-rich glycoprotein family protein [Senna tora]|uniref:Putative hydroxyproline-rich glycoprotein family protein n=1 Tax=Senna tora TaxID=362788 RepID=A0A834U3B6_9FABA|nr:putative hydroxyproline-rich glycoprotein family protein [Senna tora]